MKSKSINLSLLAGLLFISFAYASDASTDEAIIPTAQLMPIPEPIRDILDARCVMCHGAVLNGERVIRDDIDFSSDESILATLESVDIMIEVIGEDDMPQGAKLPRKLRSDPILSKQLEKLKEDYESNGEKALLMEWLLGAAKK